MVKFALIDATAESPAGAAASRYATPIANVPLICHVFDELAQNGIDRVRIVAGAEISAELGAVLGSGRTWGIEVSYIDVPLLDGRRIVLTELERALSDEPVLLHPGDCLLRGQLNEMQARYSAGGVDSALPEQAQDGGGRRPGDPRVSSVPLVLGPATRALVAGLIESAAADDLIAGLIGSDCRLAICAQTEHWCFSDSTEALLAANRMMLEELAVPAAETRFGEGNEVHGRVAISPDALISNCILHGPVIIDARAVVEDSFIGPYTALGADAILSGAEIDNSMVLAGAEIRHPGFRIESSIIGERAQVMRSFELPRGLHMRLRSDSRVTFS